MEELVVAVGEERQGWVELGHKGHQGHRDTGQPIFSPGDARDSLLGPGLEDEAPEPPCVFPGPIQR